MSNQNRGLTNSGKKSKGGGQRSGNSNNRRSFENDQRNEQGTDRQVFFHDNRQAGGTQPSGFDNRNKKSGNDNQNRGSEAWSRSGQRGARSFRINNSDKEHDLVPQATCNLVKKEPDYDSSKISPDYSSEVKKLSIKTEGKQNLADPNQSLKSDPDNPDGLYERGKRQDHGGSRKSCVTEIDGDLFTAPDDVSLAHCVGADLRMGSGIAVRFRDKFQSVGKLFDQHVGPGGVAFIPHGKRFVFYLVTKQASTGKPTNDTMRKSLIALCQESKRLSVTKIAMPQIGCGQDGLSWIDVKQMLEEIFADGFEITVYKLDKGFVDEPEPGSKSRVVNSDLYLKDVENGTGLLYISCANSFVSTEMKSIDTKYTFLKLLKSISPKLGLTVRTHLPTDDVIYGLVCKKSAQSPLSYEYLELAIQELGKLNVKDGYEYFGLQAFIEKNDHFVMDKIETLFRNSFINAEFWICWPPSLSRPSISEQNIESMEVQRSQYPSAEGQHPSNSAVPTNVEMDWTNPPELPEIPGEPDATLDNIEDEGGWFGNSSLENNASKDAEAYANDERRKSREKKESIETRKQKEKQDRTSVRPKSCVTECKGDLFDAEKTMCLAHCVGADFSMGAGIAVIFRQQFGRIGELLDQRIQQGGVAFIKHEERYIFYLVTKRKSTGKPTYETLEKSLYALHKKCKELNVTEIAMPRIGCGLDRLEWSTVRNMLDDIFADGFAIKIYNLEKQPYSSPAGVRYCWNVMDIDQMSDTMRDMQRMMERVSNKQNELLGPNGWKASANGITAQINEMGKELHQVSSKIDDLIKVVQAITGIYEDLRNRVTVLESSDTELQQRVKLLENLILPPPGAGGQGHALTTNGGYLHPFGHPEGPPPLVQNRVGQQVCPTPGAYVRGVTAVHPGFTGTSYFTSHVTSGYRNPPVYSTEQLPGERQALLRAVREAANTYRFKMVENNGNIFVARLEDPSDIVWIHSYEDLTRFCNNSGA